MDFYSVNSVSDTVKVYGTYNIHATKLDGVINLNTSVIKLTSSDSAESEIKSKLSGKINNRANSLDVAMHKVFCRDIYGDIPSIDDKDKYPNLNIFWELDQDSDGIDLIIFLKPRHINLINSINNAQTIDAKRTVAELPPHILLPSTVSRVQIGVQEVVGVPEVAQTGSPATPDYQPARAAIAPVQGIAGIMDGDALLFKNVLDLKQILVPVRERIYEADIREIISTYDVFSSNEINSTLLDYKDSLGNNVFSNELKFYRYDVATQVSSNLEQRKSGVLLNDETQSNISSFRSFLLIGMITAGSMIGYNLYDGFGKMVGSMDTMETEMVSMSGSMTNMDGTMTTMNGNMSNMSNDMSEMNSQFGTMNSHVDEMNTHVNTLSTYTKEMALNTENMEKSVDMLINPVKNLDISTQRINRNFSHINKTGDTFRKPINWMNRVSPFWD
jgi:hypothetical protein